MDLRIMVDNDLANSMGGFRANSRLMADFLEGVVWHDLQLFLQNYIEGCRDQMEVEQSQQNLMALQMECKIARLMMDVPQRLQFALALEEQRRNENE